MTNFAIEISGLQKHYPDFSLGPVDLQIPAGMIIGLIGKNGAGKTTLIKSILEIIRKDSGTVRINGKEPEDAKEDIGIVLDNSFFPEPLDSRSINSILKDVYKNWDEKLFYQYLKEFGIKDRQSLKTMSKGMRKKVEIAAALAHHPKLLILDEPTSGLDPVVRSEVLDIFQNFLKDEEHTILLSTHITSDLEHIADQIIFLSEGNVIMNTPRDVISDCYGILRCSPEQFPSIRKEDILAVRKNRYDCDILVADRAHCAEVYPECVVDRVTIEEMMLLVIKGEQNDDRIC